MKIFYFAELKQLIGKSQDLIIITKKKTVSEVIIDLRKKGKNYDYAFSKVTNIKCAINCEYVNPSKEVKNEDELALFPPVTGG